MRTLKQPEPSTKELYNLAIRIAQKNGKIGLQEPEDICQTAMMKFYSAVNPVVNPSYWLVRVVKNETVNAIRTAAKNQKHLYAESANFENDLAVSEHFELQNDRVETTDNFEFDLSPKLIEVLYGMTAPHRHVLVLAALGHSYSEIARLTDSNIGTVRSRLSYARKYATASLAEWI